jgi:hypothetical protein
VAAETKDGFTIEGKVYPTAPMQDWDMDESQILYDYTGLALEDFSPDPDLPPEDRYQEILLYMKNPGFVRTLLHIAYRRGNPTLKEDKIREVVGRVNAMKAITEFIEANEKDDAGPPASTTEQEKPSANGSVDSNATSGSSSTTASDEPDDHPVNIGTGRSATSSLEPTGATWGS